MRTTFVEVGIVHPTDMAASGLAHPPFRDGWTRLKRLGIVRDVRLEQLTPAVVRAVERDRRHVRLPRRAFTLSALPEASRRTTEWLLTGVAPRVPQG